MFSSRLIHVAIFSKTSTFAFKIEILGMCAQKSPNKEHVSRSQGLDDADYHIKEAFEILQREATRLRQEQESMDAMSKNLEYDDSPSTVDLNVGGHCFQTNVQTLTKDPNTKLAAMFSGTFKMKLCKDGSFFIDRDGTHFRYILNYLRTGKLILPEGATFLKELREEAEFYQIQGIIDELGVSETTAQASKPAQPFEESVILTNENHRRVLKGWLPYQGSKWRLLFQASRDSFAARAFHFKCNHKGPTVTIVKSGDNIFGGFAEESWCSTILSLGGWRTCKDAFLFSMINPRGLGPTKMPLKPDKKTSAISGDFAYGPLFGGGVFGWQDLNISNYANVNTRSYSCLGNAYKCPPGEQSTFFTGSTKFTVTDYEVFGLHA